MFKTIVKGIALVMALLFYVDATLLARELEPPNYDVAHGQLLVLNDVQSDLVSNRPIYVWLPPQLSEDETYEVLYVHDADMQFDSTKTWNGQSWMLDEIASELVRREKVHPFIVVAIPNAGTRHGRHAEYFPKAVWQMLPDTGKHKLTSAFSDVSLKTKSIKSDAYLRFIVDDLKPIIDQRFPVKKDRDSTAIMGSSMGGLISMYAVAKYPQVFGKAACLSTHWPGAFDLVDNPIPEYFVRFIETQFPGPDLGVEIYFDHGTETLDGLYPTLQADIDTAMRSIGYQPPQFQSLVFVGEDHSEKAWSNRLHVPLTFLFGAK